MDLSQFYSDTLSGVTKGIPGALQQMTQSQRESLDMQRQALDAYRGALSQTDGVDLPMLQFSAAIGAPTRGGLGGALSAGMGAYAGALQQQRNENLSKAEKLAVIQQGLARLHQQGGALPWENIDRTLGAATRVGEINNLANDAAFTAGLPGIGSSGTPTPSGSAMSPATGLPALTPPADLAQAAPAAAGPVANAEPSAAAPAAAPSLPEGARRLSQQEMAAARALKQQYDYASQPQFASNPKARQLASDTAARLKAIAGDDFTIDYAGGFAFPTGKAAPAYKAAEAAAKRKEQPTALEKDNDETSIELQKAARAAPQRIQELDQLSTALENTWTGKAAELTLPMRQMLKGVTGIDIGNVSDAELAQTMSNKMALELRNPAGGAGMPGALSDSDRKYLQAMTANTDKTPEGNRKILQMSVALEKRKMEVASLARQYAQANGGKIDDRFFQQLAAWSEQNPLAVDRGARASSIPDAAIAKLRQIDSPQARQQFDQIFGQGAAARALGGQ